ncbi:phage tail sheath subtilisin-like domain-containing protein [Thalassospira sp. MCCC 1A01428]|uniref:phage tail sheath subtilisin-like domain-containing protein n=1 Tax=Thalassospira sp. MCCC 1A01428 TaxID=1470575 RepID=UPI000A1F5BAE|nr:phage tail sheath subtilisin-like domain-containing protein [Thalassospira sp. MCCC 1A01428]
MPEISFNQIPLDIYRPGIYVEIDPSLASSGLPVFKQRTVMFGQLGTDPEAVAGQVYQVITSAEASVLFGKDSMLVGMVDAFRKVNPYQELLVITLADNAAGVAATLTRTFAGAATRSTTQQFYLNETRYQLGIASGDTATDVAGRLATLFNNDPACPVIASAVGADLTLTCKWKGETGNDITFATRYYNSDTVTPGLTFGTGSFADGAGNPDLTAAIDALDDLTQYQGFVTPYVDEPNMTALRAELDLRWGPLSALDGRVFAAKRDGVAALATYAPTLNSQNIAIMDTTQDALSPPWVWAASTAANVMYYGALDPARPFQTLELVGIMGAPEGKRRRAAENETLLSAGISTHTVATDGKVHIERAVTTYSANTVGAEDTAYKSLNTVMIMSYYRRSVINRFQLKYPRHKLGMNGNPAAGFASNIVTPNTAIAEFLAHYKAMVDAGIMDDFAGYKADILANKNAQKRGRLDVFDQPRPMDQFHQLAVRSAFRLI